MASDAVVNLVVDATDAERSVMVQLRNIVNDAERRAPDITLNVTIDNSSVTNITNQLSDVRRGVRDADDDTNRLSGTFGRLGMSALTAIASASRLTVVGGAAAAALPAVGALVTSIANIAPAGAAAVSGFVAMKAATATLKVGLLGVSDALSAVFDPDADPAAVEEALKNLSENAQDFVRELQDMKPALDALRLDIQDRLFQDLDKTLSRTGKVVLPELRKASLDFASTFNAMAKGAGASAQTLAKDGTLGRALGSGTRAFEELRRIPGQLLLAIGRLSAGGGPLLERLSSRIADVADSLSKRLEDAAASGALEDAISGATDALKQLGRIGGNVFEIIGNVMDVASESGTSLFGTLEQVTQALADVTAGETFRDTLSALIDVGQTLVSNVLPLLKAAFEAIAPAIQLLAPIVQDIIDTLGTELLEIIPELTPVLEAVVEVFGALWEALKPLIPVLSEMIQELLPHLTPILEDVAAIITDLAPLIEFLARGLSETLIPALGFLAGGVEQVVDWLRTLIDWITDVAGEYVKLAIETIQEIVIPAFKALAAFLRGDYREAWNIAEDVIVKWSNSSSQSVLNFWEDTKGVFARSMTDVTRMATSGFASFVRITQSGLNEAMRWIQGFPAAVHSQIGNLSRVLYDSGVSLIRGFINGMVSQLSAAASAAAEVVGAVRDFFPSSPAKKGPFSGKGYTLYSGQKMVTDWFRGMENAASRSAVRMGWLQRLRGPLIAGSAIGGNLTTSTDARSFAGLSGTAFSRTNPVVNVFIGNDQLNPYLQTVVDNTFDTFNRTASQGVRI